MAAFDHLLAFVLVVGLPVYAMVVTPATKRAIEAGETGRRAREYWLTLLELWGQGIAVLTVWLAATRPWAELGLGRPGGWGFWLLAGLLGAAVLLTVVQVRAVRASSPTRAKIRDRLQHLTFFVPHTRRELRLFSAVSVSAGVCEELSYRGFLIWYLLGLGAALGLDDGTWLATATAVALSSVAFGFAHLYLGVGDAIRAAITGAVLAGIYLGSGTLWLPMAFHALVDLNSGVLGWLAVTPEGEFKPPNVDGPLS